MSNLDCLELFSRSEGGREVTNTSDVTSNGKRIQGKHGNS